MLTHRKIDVSQTEQRSVRTLEIILSVAGLYLSSLTPMTYIGASGDGAEMTTVSAPPWRCMLAFAISLKIPVDSTTTVAPADDHGILLGSFSVKTYIDEKRARTKRGEITNRR